MIELIKHIGKQGSCSEESLKLFLPNYPTIRGSEFIFTIDDHNAKKFIDEEVENFIRGLHYIEMTYKEQSKHSFGFGSPSPTAMLIRALEKVNAPLAKELETWVAANGGNYYIMAIEGNQQSKLFL